MAIYCPGCGEEFSEKPDSCSGYGFGRVFDTGEISESIGEIVEGGSMRGRLLTLAAEVKSYREVKGMSARSVPPSTKNDTFPQKNGTGGVMA